MGLAALLACGGDERATVVLDPLAALPLAEVSQEVADLAPPGHNPAARDAGWFPGGREAPRRSRGAASEVTFFLAAPRELHLLARCAALAGAAVTRVEVAVNGSPAGAFALARDGVGEHRLRLAAALLRAGENRLRLSYRTATGGGGPDPHQEAVLWHRLSLRPMPPPRQVRRDGDALEIPAGTRLDWYLPIAEPARLELGPVQGSGGARLRVLVGRDGEPEREVLEVARARRGRRAALPAAAGSPVLRLAFFVLPSPDAPAGAPGSVRVERPRLVVRGSRAAARVGSSPAAVSARAGQAASPARRPPVLLVLVDALRRDRLGAYGSRRGLTPHLDRFAAEATVFEQAVAQAPWTRPAVATLFTGLGPLGHGVTAIEHRLPDAATTLAERFREAGYRTAAVSTNYHVSRQSGLQQGFDSFQLLPLAPTPAVTRAALRWLDRQRPARPWLLYLHALEPHAPYDPPEDLRARLAPTATPEVGDDAWVQRFFRLPPAERERFAAPLADLYDAEVAAFDRAFGELRAELERRGRWDGTLVMLVADHGEALGEHGVVGHAWNLHDETLAIPLLIKLPGQRAGARIAALAQQLDALPTLLAAAGLPPAPGAPGVDLLAAPAPERVAVSHLAYRGREGLAATWRHWRLIEPSSGGFGGRRALHDLRADPREERDVLAAHPVLAGWLLTGLRAELRRGRGRGEEAELDAEARAALAALGYL